jgi:hypothetical protein
VPSNPERLLNWFRQNAAQLKAWTAQSESHARLMLLDPLQAIRAAGLAIPDDLIPELQSSAKAIATMFQRP